MKFSNQPLNLRCRGQRRAHLRSSHLSAVPFSAPSERPLVDGNAVQSLLPQGHLDLGVDCVLLLFFTLCYQSPYTQFFYKLFFCLLPSGHFYVKFRIIYHFLTESTALSFALCFCRHCFIAAYAISFKSSLILSCYLIYSVAQR